MVDMTSPFSHFLKEDEKFIWDDKRKNDLDNIKIHLTNTPILTPYNLDKTLLLYSSTTLSALGEMLTKKDDKNKEITIYYISKTLLDYDR